MKAKHGGNGIDPNKTAIEGQTILNKDGGMNGGISYQSMSLSEALAAIAKGYNKIVDNAKVPELLWKPEKDLSAEDKNFPVKDNTAIVSGVGDQVIEDGKDLAGLVGMGLTVISNPSKTADELSGFADAFAGDPWGSTQQMVKAVVSGTAQVENFGKGGEYARYATGRVGVTIVKAVIAAPAFFAKVKNVPKALAKKADDILVLLDKIKKLLKTTFKNWSEDDITKYADEIAAGVDDACDATCAVGKYGCFTPNTPIETPEANTFEPAKSIRIGMKIMSYNHGSNRKEPKPVTAIQRHWVSGLLLLSLNTGELIETTPNHPFYVRNQYKNAENLRIGDTLFTAKNESITLTRIAKKDTLIEVFNFTVADNSNYFVGKTGVLVHNTDCLIDNLKKNFPNLDAKLQGLSEEAKKKFLKDFESVDDNVLGKLENSEVLLNRAIANPDYLRAIKEYDANKVYDINGQKPINSGKPNPQFTANGQAINFDSNGFPDFTDHVHSINGKKQYYEIDMQGNYTTDFSRPDALAGITEQYRIDNNLTWHHHQDGKTMMLVPRNINSGIRHTGGRAIIDHNKDFPQNVLYFPSPIIN